MTYKLLPYFTIILFLMSCSVKKEPQSNSHDIKPDTITLFDKARNRKVPVAYFNQKTRNKISKQRVVIFSHGYGANKGGDYLIYSYLTKNLATKGYFVASIQHELPTDEMIPSDGKPQIVRMPFWKRGTENILFVLNELKKSHPELDYEHITLIGHSNGGDMTALFATQHPDLVYKIITMDNRRMYLPKTSSPKIYTLRSNDYPADEGVLPSDEEQRKFRIVVQPTHINHGNMDDKANDQEKKTLNSYIEGYLSEK